MLRRNLLVDDITQGKLDPVVLDELAASLWPQDCQTCEWSLGDGQCALVVDVMAYMAHASIHHPKCSEPNWNDSGYHKVTSGPLISWVAVGTIIPAAVNGDQISYIPGVIVNPSLEMVNLGLGKDGRWELSTLTRVRESGFEPPMEGMKIGTPVRDSHLVITPTSWRVIIPGSIETYEVSPEPQMTKLVAKTKAILAIVTQAADPGALRPETMPSVMSSKHTLVGWVPLYEP